MFLFPELESTGEQKPVLGRDVGYGAILECIIGEGDADGMAFFVAKIDVGLPAKRTVTPLGEVFERGHFEVLYLHQVVGTAQMVAAGHGIRLVVAQTEELVVQIRDELLVKAIIFRFFLRIDEGKAFAEGIVLPIHFQTLTEEAG